MPTGGPCRRAGTSLRGGAGVPEAAVGIAPVLVTRPHPLAQERLLRALVLVPVAGAGAVALDEQIADFALRHVTPVVIHDPGIVARHQRAARAGAHVPAPVRDERMTQFGRPDPVQNLEPEALEPALVDRLGERFARREAESD